MLPHERQFPAFVFSVLSGLSKAIATDPDVFLLALTGCLLGSSGRRRRGLARALGLYVTFRRLDCYVDAGIQLARRSHLTSASQPPGAYVSVSA